MAQPDERHPNLARREMHALSVWCAVIHWPVQRVGKRLTTI
jgi:hypothetical protein